MKSYIYIYIFLVRPFSFLIGNAIAYKCKPEVILFNKALMDYLLAIVRDFTFGTIDLYYCN